MKYYYYPHQEVFPISVNIYEGLRSNIFATIAVFPCCQHTHMKSWNVFLGTYSLSTMSKQGEEMNTFLEIPLPWKRLSLYETVFFLMRIGYAISIFTTQKREHCVVAICHIFVGSVREIQKNSFLFSTYLVKDFQACACVCSAACSTWGLTSQLYKNVNFEMLPLMCVLSSCRAHDAAATAATAAAVGN